MKPASTLEVKIEGAQGETSIVMLENLSAASPVDSAQCRLCSFMCTSRVDIKDHLMTQHQRVVIYCSVCGDGFDDNAKRDQHQYYCAGNYMLTCIKCELKTIGDRSAAKLHEVQNHRGQEKKKLYIEVERSEGQGRLQRCFVCGLDGCRQSKVKCTYCGQVVDNDFAHMQNDHPFTPAESVWPVSCRFYKTPQQGNVITGRRVQTSDDTSCIECTTCGFTDADVSVVVDHVKEKHYSKSSKHCVHCHMVFGKYEVWRDHEHFCGGGDVLACALCGVLCGGLKAMNDHICRNHPEQKGLLAQTKPGHRPKKMVTMKRVTPWSQDDDVEDDEYDDSRSRTLAKPEEEVEPTRLCLVCGEDKCSKRFVKCVLCQRTVLSQLSHMKHHPFTPEHRWVVTCDHNDETVADFVRAERIYHGRKMRTAIKCNVCKTFMSHGVKEMSVHMGHYHPDEDCYRCVHCSSFMANSLEARDHEHYCGGGQLITCQLCDVACGSFEQLIEHVKVTHADEDVMSGQSDDEPVHPKLILTAEFLGKYFADHALNFIKDEEEDTLVLENDGNERVQDCFVCEGRCQVTTAKQKRLKCMLCNAAVYNSGRHMLDAHPHTPKDSPWNVTCGAFKKACDFVVMRQSNTVDPRDGLSRIECRLCSFQTKLGQEEECVMHFQDIHKSAVYFCKYCHQGFRKPNFKKDHERFCIGLGFPRCRLCSRRCTGYDALYDHMKQVHAKATKKKRQRADNVDGGDDDTDDVREPNKKLAKHLQSADVDVSTAEPDANGYVKLCGSCGTMCVSHDVRCLLCFRVVAADTKHMLEDHPLTPSRTWIVSCKNTNAIRGGWKTKKGNLVLTGPDKFLIGTANQVAMLVHDGAVAGQEVVSDDRVPLDITCLLPHSDDTIGVLQNLDAFAQHLRDKHDDLTVKTIQMCSHCNLIFTLHDHYNKMNFIDHVQFCSGGGLYVCEMCDMTFSSCRKNNEHMQSKHKDLLQPKQSSAPQVIVPPGQFIQCPECSFKAETFKKYGEHVREMHQYKVTQVQVCSFCFETFKVCSKRELHEQTVHKGGERLMCLICNRQFNTPTSLRAHTKYYHEGGRIKQKIYRDNKTRIPCSYCGRLFQLGIHVQQHERTAHLHQKPYQCRVCGVGFTNHSAWKTHEDRHTGVKRYKCPYCDYRAYKGSRVNEHIKTKHPGRKRAFGNDVIEYNVGDVIAKGDEFIVEGSFSYKPRLRREDFDFGDYEDSFVSTVGLPQPLPTTRVAGQEIYIRTVVDNDAMVNINGVTSTVTSASGSGADTSLIYMTPEELRAAIGDDKKLELLTSSADAGDEVRFIVDESPATPSGGGLMPDKNVQYVLDESGDSVKDIHYVVESDSVNDEAKQEVEFIINSAVSGGGSAAAAGSGSFLINGSTSANKYMSELNDDSKEQIYFIVNKQELGSN